MFIWQLIILTTLFLCCGIYFFVQLLLRGNVANITETEMVVENFFKRKIREKYWKNLFEIKISYLFDDRYTSGNYICLIFTEETIYTATRLTEVLREKK
jgi:hypothetical protein